MFANYTDANCQQYVRNKIIHLRHDSIKKETRSKGVNDYQKCVCQLYLR